MELESSEMAMTAKDQAIALAIERITLTLECEDLVQSGPLTGALEALKQAKPAPDCRTCEHIEGTYCANRIHRAIICTNGDQYIEAPQVVLWRTE